MTCSSIDIKGVGNPTTITPKGPSLLVANLQADVNVAPVEDALWSKCHSENETSIMFPYDKKGLNLVVRSPKALSLQEFPGNDDPACGSDNEATIRALRSGDTSERKFKLLKFLSLVVTYLEHSYDYAARKLSWGPSHR